MGREYKISETLKSASNPTATTLTTYTEFDITGKPLRIKDPKQYATNGVYTFEYIYDMSSNPLKVVNIDSGTKTTIVNFAGNPLYIEDLRSRVKYSYDQLQRPKEVKVTENGVERVAEKYIYGETLADPQLKNYRGQLFVHYDQSGKTIFNGYSFKGELLSNSKILITDYKTEADWNDTNIGNSGYLESETFNSSSKFNAIGAVVEQNNPDGSVYKPEYHISGRLDKVKVKLSGESTFSDFVTGIGYNSKGQRDEIRYGNGTITTYSYDEKTFRLTNLTTVRDSDRKKLQNLSYYYDPVGNITKKVDSSQQTVYFNNSVISPTNSYLYDSLYRLIEGEGREHAGQTLPVMGDGEIPRENLPHANSSTALRNYTRSYVYDLNGNMATQTHSATGANWVKSFSYDAGSNRLTGATIGQSSLTYSHDINGNMINIDGLSDVEWDYRNNLSSSLKGDNRTYYNYDSSGERVRKTTENNSGVKVKETIYVDGAEIFREFAGGSVTSEIKTLHVMDDKQRIALVEKRTIGAGSTTPLVRYQYADHLQSSSVEADASGNLISFEEYYPYGGTSYHSVKSNTEISTKRYRFNGKEKDTETGLYYYGARYYAPWICRWMSCDPIGAEGSGLNMYWFNSGNPISRVDLDGQFDYPVETLEPDNAYGSNPLSKTNTEYGSYMEDATKYWADFTIKAEQEGGFLGGLKYAYGWFAGCVTVSLTPELAPNTLLTLGTAGLGVMASAGKLGAASLPTLKTITIWGGYESATSVTEAVTGTASGTHAYELAEWAWTGEYQGGGELSTGERVLRGSLGTVMMGFSFYGSSILTKQTLAFNFYSSSGWNHQRIYSHMKGINYNKPVEIVSQNKGSTFIQYQIPKSPMGNYFSDIGTPCSKLGIYSGGRQLSILNTADDVLMLKSTAAKITDTWSVPGLKINTSGGGTQYFARDFDLNKFVK